MSNEKKCTKCGEVLPLDLFTKDKQKKDGLRSSCKVCMKKIWKDNYHKIAESHRSRNKRYAQLNKEKVSAYHKEYYLENKDSISDYGKRYREENRDQVIASKKAWKANIRSEKAGVYGELSRLDIEYLRLNNKDCYYCGSDVRENYEIDHKTPISRGGDNTVNNIVICCHDCNQSKGSKTEKEYRDWAKRIK